MLRSPFIIALVTFVALASTSATIARGLCAERVACAIRPCCAEGDRPAPVPPTTLRARMACCEAKPEVPVARAHVTVDDTSTVHAAPLPAQPPSLMAPSPAPRIAQAHLAPRPRPPIYLSKCSLLC